MRHTLLILFAILSGAIYAQRPLDSLYQCLDDEIERFPEYVANHDKEVALLTHELDQAHDEELRYDLSYRLYDKYRAFINDSAIYYLNQCIRLAERLNRPARAGECRSLLALRCSNAGMYDEALEILSQINPQTLDQHALGVYYEAQNHVYNELAYYTHLEDMRVKYQETADKYQEQLLAVVPDTSDVSYLRREMIDMTAGRYEQSKAINDEWLTHVSPGSHRYALVALYR